MSQSARRSLIELLSLLTFSRGIESEYDSAGHFRGPRGTQPGDRMGARRLALAAFGFVFFLFGAFPQQMQAQTTTYIEGTAKGAKQLGHV